MLPDLLDFTEFPLMCTCVLPSQNWYQPYVRGMLSSLCQLEQQMISTELSNPVPMYLTNRLFRPEPHSVDLPTLYSFIE